MEEKKEEEEKEKEEGEEMNEEERKWMKDGFSEGCPLLKQRAKKAQKKCVMKELTRNLGNGHFLIHHR